jgi:hypothetical protein
MKRVRLPRITERRPLAAGAVILWIAVSPWVWGFAGSHAAVANHVALVLGFGPLAVLIAQLRPAAVVTLLAGVWLAVSPWLLGYATDHAAWVNELVTGSLLIAVCASAATKHSIMARNNERHRPTTNATRVHTGPTASGRV